MRCLHCGKAIPLLKRLANSEFCSEAHRREYQDEYSQLALGRLLQSDPAESQARSGSAPPLARASEREVDEPTGAKTKSHGPHTAVKANAVVPNGTAKSLPLRAIAATTESEPAAAELAFVQKPTPAAPQNATKAATALERLLATIAPGRPRRQPRLSPAELLYGRVVAWESLPKIADSPARPIELKLNLREVPRPAPRIGLNLRAAAPEFLQVENQTLPITTVPAVPAAPLMWMSPACDFACELASLSDFADAQFANSDFEAPAADAHAEAVSIPDPQLQPLPVSSDGIAPRSAKPIPVFEPVPIVAATVQIPQPTGLPLRPVMVLETNSSAGGKDRSSKPALQHPVPSTVASAMPGLGSPELNRENSTAPTATRVRTIVTALAGVVLLSTGILFVVGKQGRAGLRSPTPAIASGAGSTQWISNYAPDARRQRRVLLLRSSMNLQSYRLDFESSIRIKALGWVYRAQDSKNFYVSKIEFKKPGVNPVYALVHYAVINGVEQKRVETPLHESVPMGGGYKIRFEAIGNRFTTWVQGKQVGQWSDARISSGGAGLYSEGAEESALHGEFVVTPL